MEMELLENGLSAEELAVQQPEGLAEGMELPQEPVSEPLEEEPPKKKRASRKKADKAEETAADTSEGGDGPSPLGDVSPELSEDGQLDPKNGIATGDCVVMGLTEQEDGDLPPSFEEELEEDNPPPELPLMEDDLPESPQPAAEQPPASRTSSRNRAGRSTEGRRPLLSLNLNELDRGLTEQERQEWNDVYASYRSKSVLTGKIIGVEAYTFNVRNNETGQVERKRMYCAAVIPLKVKILIPETEMWMPGEERPTHVLRNMSGAEIDFVILDVDRKGYVATASRRMGTMIKRRAFDRARGGHEPGERLPCRFLNVGPSRCLVECGGRDITLRYQDISYTSYSDLRAYPVQVVEN